MGSFKYYFYYFFIIIIIIIIGVVLLLLFRAFIVPGLLQYNCRVYLKPEAPGRGIFLHASVLFCFPVFILR